MQFLKLKLQAASTFRQDFLASLVVFLVALPLCLGIAIASGAPPAAGLITGIIGGLVVGFFSGCPLQVSGPAAGLAVIVYELIQDHGFAMLGPLIMVAGLLQILAGFFRLGQLFRSMAPAVVYGMLAGIGILIFGAQFHVMVDDKPRESGIANLVSIPEAIYKGIFPVDGSSHHIAAAIGITTILSLLLWTKFAPARFRWIPGALIGVGAATLIAQVLSLQINFVELPDNLLSAVRPPTLNEFSRLTELNLLIAAVTLAFVASAETMLSAAAVDQMQDGPRTNYDRELLSQGVGNSLAGFLGGLPMTGVIVRSATNINAGAKSRASTVMHGLWLLSLVAAAPSLLRLVPTASLAAVLVYTGYKLVNPQNIRRLLRYGKVPVVIYAATVVMIVATDLLTGIITGLVLSLLKVLHALSHMKVEVRRDSQRGRVDVFITGAATFIRLPALVDALNALPDHSEVHIHIEHALYIDHACLEAISTWERQRDGKGGRVVMEWETAMDRQRSAKLPAASPNIEAHAQVASH